MSVVYLKHHKADKTYHSFIRHLKQRRVSSLIVLAGFIIGFLTLLINIIVSATNHREAKIAQIVDGQVQGTFTENIVLEEAPSPPPAPQETPPTPTPTKKLSKSYYTIAVIGDSMVDTMGERMEYLEGAIKKKYPGTTFFLYNYGIGAQTIEDGLKRFGEDFKYKDRNFPSIAKIEADVIIVGSFAYNPFSPHDRDKHWLGLTNLVKEALKKKDADVYMIAEIAPLRRNFGKGPGGVNWDEDTSFRHSGNIIEQLENAIGLGKALRVPVIDIYHKSLSSGTEGKRELVDTHDGIHPGVQGQEFMAEQIAEALKLE